MRYDTIYSFEFAIAVRYAIFCVTIYLLWSIHTLLRFAIIIGISIFLHARMERLNDAYFEKKNNKKFVRLKLHHNSAIRIIVGFNQYTILIHSLALLLNRVRIILLFTQESAADRSNVQNDWFAVPILIRTLNCQIYDDVF